ncbi:DEXQc_Suv3 domain containing protein [Methylophilaceae bacterium]
MISVNLNLDDYAHSFAKARAIQRHHHFYVGPTNSGKTYHALNTLMAAKSGVYLAPLRLLAMEVRDKLMEAGVPCNLITGEERIIIAGAQHTASTIEMMNPIKLVDVAIIDEIQMLQDPDRGSAWTAALVGVPARQVFICGSNAVTKLCLQVIVHLNETAEITELRRMTPLILEDESLCGKRYSKPKLKAKLNKGDAIIAFSRKDVLTFSARFRQWGFTVASIYGALSPEVRRHESARFCSGEAEILVATDAIGMGLNLPIRRVIFANIFKFDGAASRLLNATEVRQIAGRAGRFGLYENGYVNILESDERFHIEHMLATDDTADSQKLPIAVNIEQIEAISNQLHTAKISECLEYFANRLQFNHALFTLSKIKAQIHQAMFVDEFASKLSLKDKFIFTCAPIAINMNIEKDYFLLCLKSVVEHTVRKLPPSPVWLNSFNPKYLESAEILSQNISLYAWLSYKFPQIFVDAEQIPPLRLNVSRYIEHALLTQTGYIDTQRESDFLKRIKR